MGELGKFRFVSIPELLFRLFPTCPCRYSYLAEEEKQANRNSAMQNLKLLVGLGYHIQRGTVAAAAAAKQATSIHKRLGETLLQHSTRSIPSTVTPTHSSVRANDNVVSSISCGSLTFSTPNLIAR
jgi:hypothetical protein